MADSYECIFSVSEGSMKVLYSHLLLFLPVYHGVDKLKIFFITKSNLKKMIR